MAEAVDTRRLATDMLREALRAGQPIEIAAFGTSMWPRLKAGELVRVAPCKGTDLRVGDVALFDGGGQLVLHRVLRTGPTRVLLKGDAAVDPDGWVSHTAILGRMAQRPGDRALGRLAPHLGRVIGFASAVARRTHGFASKF